MNSTPVPKLLFILLVGLLSACGSYAPDAPLTPDAAVSPPDGQDGASTLPVSVPDKSGSGGSAPSTVATPLGLQCARDQDCGSGHCTDGVCCDTACDGICQSCALTGKLGACAPVADATDDTCNGASTCDATGACREGLGGPCAAGSDCASGSCVDGICCGSATCGTCQSCGLPGSRGHCAPVPPLTDDVDSACAGDTTCNGLGACDRKNGQACAGATDCASRQCVDGICCATTCEGTCYACNVSGKEGACAPITRVEDPAAATPCTGASYCDAHPDHAPVCLPKLADGVPCTFALQCESGVCGTYYVDADNDGYGSRAVTTCGRRPAPGASAVGGDCCDSAANVNPGITTFSVVPNACGKFDFNCDGIEERVNGKTVPCGTGIRIMLSKLNGIDTPRGLPMTSASAVLCGVALLFCVGCSPTRVPAHAPRCEAGSCPDASTPRQERTSCSKNDECAVGFACESRVCAATAPTAGDYHACGLDLDCPIGDHCSLGACAHDCVADRDCAENRTCDLRGHCASRAATDVPPASITPAAMAPVLATDETALDFTDFAETKTLTIRNVGLLPLAFRILGDKPWLAATPVTGTLAPSASTVVTVSVQSIGTGSRGTLSVVSTGGVASAAVTVPDRVAGLYQGEVVITAPTAMGRRALALRLAQDSAGRLQGVVDDARSPAFGHRAALDAASAVNGQHVTLGFTIPGQVGFAGSSSQPIAVTRTLTLDGVISAGGRLTGRYTEAIRGAMASPVVLSGTFELLPVDRGAPLLPPQGKPAEATAPAAPTFLACDACPSGKCPTSHAAAGADFLRAAFRFFGTALADGTGDAYAPIRACVDEPSGCYNPIALHCAQAHFYKALQEKDAGTCPETGQVACAQRGLIDSFKGLLVWNSLVGNEHLVRAYALGRTLDEQLTELGAARDAFQRGFTGDSAGGAQVYGMLDPFFLGWIASLPASTWSTTQSSFFPEQLSLPGGQQSKVVPAFGDLDRVASEMALWVQSVGDHLAARHRRDATDGPELVLQAGRDVAEAHVALAAAGDLLARVGIPPDRLVRAVNRATALAQTAAKIGSGLNPAGYPDTYIAYTYPPALGAASNNYLELVRDFSGNWLAAATNAHNTAQSAQRDFESTYQNLAREVTALNADYGKRVADLCGGSARSPSLGGCGTSAGLVFDTVQQVKSAQLRFQNASTALRNQYQSIQIEQNRAAQQVNLHEVTAFAITADGRKLEALADRDAVLDEMEAASGGFFGAVSALGALPPNIGGAIAAVGGAIVGGAIANARNEIEKERIRIDTIARARVEYDQAQSQLIDSAARVKTMLLELPTLRINALVAELDIARLLGLLRSQMQEAGDTVAALDRQQKLSGGDPRRDPAFRQYRDVSTTHATKALDSALGQLFLVTRALEYETGMTFARRAELFSFTTPAALASYLGDVEAAYQRFIATIGNRQQRATTISMRDQIFHFATPLVDNATGQVLPPSEVFHQLLADPRNRDLEGNVRLAFTLSLAPDALIFNANLCTDTLTGLRISLVGAALGATQPEVVVQQRGSAYLRSCTDRDQNGDYLVSEYGLESTVGLRRAIVQAGLNLSGPNDVSSGGPVNTEFYGRPIAAPYELVVDRRAPANAGLDLTKLDDIVLFIQHESRTVR